MANSSFEDPSQGHRPHSALKVPPTTTTTRPHVWEFVLHPVKTLRFVGSLAHDPRISPLRKMLYVTVVGALLVSLLVPEGLIAALVTALLPLIGPLIAVPADAAVDWLLVGTFAYALLGLFPAHVVREHHARIFHPRRRQSTK